MFEAAKIGRKVHKDVFKKDVVNLRSDLLDLQLTLREQKIPLVVLIAGMEGAGKGEVVNRLNEWLDTRGVEVHAFWEESDEERDRPLYWRYWRALPSAGNTSILFSGWYLQPIEKRYFKEWDDADLEQALRRINEFERSLVEDGCLVIKFWYHYGENQQCKRLKTLARNDRSRWKMFPKKAEFADHYRRFEHIADQVVRKTDIGRAPWYVIEATDARYRDLATGQTLLRAMTERLSDINGRRAESVSEQQHSPSLPEDPEARVTLIDRMDLSLSLDKKAYKLRLAELQERINELAWQAYKAKRSPVLVFEGIDAAGKGGAIRRITQSVDARLYRVIPIAAPTDEEQAHHYLWRFWRHIPRAGRMAIFDRSWYGRVLVERVEGFASPKRWRRAYQEINDFEEQLTESGIILQKFWLQISNEEQLARFKAREDTPYKRYKITDEDWRNREKWNAYKEAVDEMLVRTSTEHAPWSLIPANDKRYARIAILQQLKDKLEQSLG